jgi:RNA 2',3'-cyclic 3'-phosphodiesterase
MNTILSSHPTVRASSEYPLPSESPDISQATDRLFLAIFPNANARGQMVQLAQKWSADHGLRGRPQPVDRLHLTLHHLGDYSGLPTEVVRTAETACSAVAATMPSFEVELDHIKSFSGKYRRPLVILDNGNNAALFKLQRHLGVALGVRGANLRFTPHITLLYDEQSLAAKPIEPLRWTVKDFVLIHSLLGKSRYIELGRWTLCG